MLIWYELAISKGFIVIQTFRQLYSRNLISHVCCLKMACAGVCVAGLQAVEEIRRFLYFAQTIGSLLVHYYGNVILIPSPTPCPTITPAHNLAIPVFDGAAWGNLALVCFAHDPLKY